jgi:mono/diheme cytochrome c family protein
VSTAESTGRHVLPLVIAFLVVSGIVFTLARLHLARPGLPKITSSKIVLGDFYAGQTLFTQKCGACHGSIGQGGSIGPKLEGLRISLARAKAQIDAGGGTMPGGLVKGKQEADVLAYLATILGKPS